MYHKKFDKEILLKIKELYRYDNWHAVLAILYDYLIIIFSIFLSEQSYWFLPLTILLIGSRQRALATILHEASHSALTKNKKFGQILGTYFSGYLIFQSWNSYCVSHVKNHHPKLGTDSDPDYKYYKDSGIFQTYSRIEFLWRFCVSQILCLKLFRNFKYLIKNRLFSDITGTELFKLLLSQLILFVIGTYFVGYKFYVIYWLLPYLTAFQMITWFIELSEHYPMIQTAKNNLEVSRNRFSHAIEHFFTGIHGENYHLIHHLFPAIPFWNLEKAHKILMKDFDYQEVNKDFGGIFFSKNNNAPMWKVLWSKYEAA